MVGSSLALFLFQNMQNHGLIGLVVSVWKGRWELKGLKPLFVDMGSVLKWLRKKKIHFDLLQSTSCL